MPLENGRRRKLGESSIDRPVVGDPAEFQKLEHGGIIDIPREPGRMQRRDRGGERQLTVTDRVHERLDSEPIAHQCQRASRVVPDANRKHPAKLWQQRVDAPLAVSVDEDFGIAFGSETTAARFEFTTKVLEVIDRAVRSEERRVGKEWSSLLGPV